VLKKLSLAGCIIVLLFANWMMVPRGMSDAKIDVEYLLNNCSSLKGASPNDVTYDHSFLAGGNYFSDKGLVATRGPISESLCIAYIACLIRPELLPDCNPST
jgi:hypothetical protein